MLVAALALYGVGVLAAFSPCSVPLYPALLATWTAGGTRRWMTVAAFVAAWTQLYGLISFEITNQTRGFVTETDALFEVTVRRLAHRIGLR